MEGGELLSAAALLVMAKKRANAQSVLVSELGNGNKYAKCDAETDFDRHRAALLGEFAVQEWPSALHTPDSMAVRYFLDRMVKTRDIYYDGIHCHSDELNA